MDIIWRIGDVIEVGQGHDPSDPASTLVVMEGKDGDKLVGRSFLSSGSRMWIAMLPARGRDATRGAWELEIAAHNASGISLHGQAG